MYIVDGKWYILRAHTSSVFSWLCVVVPCSSSSFFILLYQNRREHLQRVPWFSWGVYTFRVCHSYIIFSIICLKKHMQTIISSKHSSREPIHGWWFGTWLDYFPIILGMSSSQLTLTPWFFRGGWLKPPPVLLLTIINHIISIIINHY